ncbi:hypothetical protein GCM10025789_17200 [Tessaracoccus lubricantis]|uniref:DUF998 domain-containing protein n=1 Tax=Tessaracoccus lubricantis TaxID=545543 RepID=A0ABP9FE14_9ACTN
MTTTLNTTTPAAHTAQAAPAWLSGAAFAGAAGISSIALFDAATHGLTGAYSQFADGNGSWLFILGTLVHGLGYLALAAVLFLRSRDIDGGSGAVRWFRRLTAVCFAALGAVFLIGTFVHGPLMDEVGSAIGGVTFFGMFLFGAALGISLLATRRRTPAAWTLTAILSAAALLVLLALVAPDWAHPAYPETAVHFGAALLVLPQPRSGRRLA